MITVATHIRIKAFTTQGGFGLGQRHHYSVELVKGEETMPMGEVETKSPLWALDYAKGLSRFTDLEVELPDGTFTYWENM